MLNRYFTTQQLFDHPLGPGQQVLASLLLYCRVSEGSGPHGGSGRQLQQGVVVAPQTLEAQLSLTTLQQQPGRLDWALKALESMDDSDILAPYSNAAQKVGWTLRRPSSCLHFIKWLLNVDESRFTQVIC